ncbi:MAG TPA: TonB-dependent receptor, partial [Caulobacteraceae bacterium]
VYSQQLRPAFFSQGCQPGSLYDDAAFGTPYGLALPFVFSMLALGGDCSSTYYNPYASYCGGQFALGQANSNGHYQTLVGLDDPYGGKMQSRDLRTIASFRDPVYRAKADLIELNIDVDLTDSLTFYSQTAYNEDKVYSFQDFNRFNTEPIFTDTSQLSNDAICVDDDGDFNTANICHGNGVPSYWADLAPGGIFCDPQLGCSNTLAGFDISQAKGRQFTQELRLQSDFEGPFNFSAGANYTRFQTLIDYYVFYNMITAFAQMTPFNGGERNPGPDINKCWAGIVDGFIAPVPMDDPTAMCPYIDPNPIESINGEGHNYFRSKNPYKLKSWAAFGEGYLQIRDDLKITAGVRYTDDRKTFIPVPSQVLLAPGVIAGGTVNRGYPEKPAIKQHWGEWSGRLGVDWKPDLSFTDDTMLYAFYSRGYKGGGANPPSPGFATEDETLAFLEAAGMSPFFLEFYKGAEIFPILELTAVEYGPTFRPEFVNAFEVGAKNTLMAGALTVNTNAFFYDYTDYQVSQIRDRTAVNENFDAKIWGLEFQTTFAPSRDFQVIANLGYLDTEIADGMKSIDIMNRTQDDPNYVLVKPWAQLPSNCVLPLHVAEYWVANSTGVAGTPGFCGGFRGLLKLFGATYPPVDPSPPGGGGPAFYDYRNYPELNGGAGIKDELGGNELPNSPHWTANVGAQYGMDFLEDWRVTVRGDAYWQSQSWARVYNAVNDKLHGWYNVNLSVWFEKPDQDLKIELYAKNLLDKTPITDAFLNSDDTALTTNVFVLDPRLIGLSIKKGF